MAVPARKTSHARKSSRRSSVWKLEAPTLVTCSNCGELTAAHKACTNGGMYKGRQVVEKERRLIRIASLHHGRQSFLHALFFYPAECLGRVPRLSVAA